MIIVTNIVIAVATVVYAFINYKQLKESQETRKQKTTPLIVAFLKTMDTHTVLSLHIKNIGEGLAKNVKITLLKDYNRKNMGYVSENTIIKNGVNIFPPQYEFKLLVDFISNLEEGDAQIINIEVEYEDMNKQKYKDRYELPFNQYVGQFRTDPPETFIGQIPYYLQKIDKKLNTISNLKND